MNHHLPPTRGYTLAELMVATGVAALLALLINQIFFETTNAVGRGVATSRIVNTSRTISEALHEDSGRMLGPVASSGGVLVISNHRFADIAEWNATAGGEVKRTTPTRSDQLLFIVDIDRLGAVPPSKRPQPLTPLSNGSLFSYTDARYARIWYGHVLRTDPDGTGPAAGDLDLSTGQGVGSAVGPNYLATHWVLGRQMLYFHDSAIPGDTYARLPIYSGPVVGYTISAPLELRSGLTDVVYFSYRDETSAGGVANGTLVGGGASSAILRDGLGDAAYRTGIYGMMFLNQRLRVNPAPTGAAFANWQIAQTHAYLAEGVSDFIVEFAADAADDGVGAFPDNTPDVDGAGNLIWYGQGNLPPWNTYYTTTLGRANPTDSTPGVANASVIFKFRHDEPELWPYLIRIRYRLHDPKGELQDFNNVTGVSEPGKWFEQIIAVRRS